MTKFGSPSWESRLKERRKYRDHYRAKFFSEHGMNERLRNSFGFDPAPGSQIAIVAELTEKAKEALGSDTSAHDVLATLISGSAFSVPVVSVTAFGRPTTESQSLSRLANNHFSLSIAVRQKD